LEKTKLALQNRTIKKWALNAKIGDTFNK